MSSTPSSNYITMALGGSPTHRAPACRYGWPTCLVPPYAPPPSWPSCRRKSVSRGQAPAAAAPRPPTLLRSGRCAGPRWAAVGAVTGGRVGPGVVVTVQRRILNTRWQLLRACAGAGASPLVRLQVGGSAAPCTLPPQIISPNPCSSPTGPPTHPPAHPPTPPHPPTRPPTAGDPGGLRRIFRPRGGVPLLAPHRAQAVQPGVPLLGRGQRWGGGTEGGREGTEGGWVGTEGGREVTEGGWVGTEGGREGTEGGNSCGEARRRPQPQRRRRQHRARQLCRSPAGPRRIQRCPPATP